MNKKARWQCASGLFIYIRSMENDEPPTQIPPTTPPSDAGGCLGWAVITFVLDTIAGLIVLISGFSLHGGHMPSAEPIHSIFMMGNFGFFIFAASKGRDTALGFFCGALLPVMAVLIFW